MNKSAFTMIEMIMVMVIFGIVATIGANIISKMYMNYIQARVVNYLQAQSSLTLQQVSKRFQYRIKDSTVARHSSNGSVFQLSDSRVNEDFNVIQWIGYSNEAFIGVVGNPGWSGFVDLYSTSTDNASQTLSTPGSDLTIAASIIGVLSGGNVTLTSAYPAALIFKVAAPTYLATPEEGYGWDGGGGKESYMSKVRLSANDQFTIIGTKPNEIYEQYYLAHSAYAIAAEEHNLSTRGASVTDDQDFDLRLYYNYQPWNGQSYTDGSSALLATHVSLFRVKQVGSAIHIKLCLHDNNASGLGRPVAACKEEVVL